MRPSNMAKQEWDGRTEPLEGEKEKELLLQLLWGCPRHCVDVRLSAASNQQESSSERWRKVTKDMCDRDREPDSQTDKQGQS